MASFDSVFDAMAVVDRLAVGQRVRVNGRLAEVVEIHGARTIRFLGADAALAEAATRSTRRVYKTRRKGRVAYVPAE